MPLVGDVGVCCAWELPDVEDCVDSSILNWNKDF